MTEKHVVIGCKHDMLGNQTFEVLQLLSKLSHQGLIVFEFVDMLFSTPPTSMQDVLV